MYLIATDEAGYGPKLGPLVIVATTWKLPGDRLTSSEAAELFSVLSTPTQLGDLSVAIADSKQVYRPGDGLRLLHAAVSAGLAWCGSEQTKYPGLFEYLCPNDVPEMAQSPWLSPKASIPMADGVEVRPLVDRWSASGIDLVDVKARVFSARSFNRAIASGFNKADLLSHSTIGLVRDRVAALSTLGPHVAVYCDRHGGRRFYGGALQHHFPDRLLQVVGESKDQSRYRLVADETELEVHFTVKGDRFAPVAFSSMFAKYLRERLMESLNAFFAQRYLGEEPLKSTAGYPVDADRFLNQIAAIRQQEQIADVDLVRLR